MGGKKKEESSFYCIIWYSEVWLCDTGARSYIDSSQMVLWYCVRIAAAYIKMSS